MSSTLEELARTVGLTPDHPEWGGTDKGEQVHGYLAHYERLLEPIRDRNISLLEVGVCGGGGLRMWAGWMPNAHVVGVEVDPVMVYNDPPRIVTHLCDVQRYEPDRVFDVIIDDGSHETGEVATALARLWPYLVEDGWYIIEDLTSDGLRDETERALADHVVPVDHPHLLVLQR